MVDVWSGLVPVEGSQVLVMRGADIYWGPASENDVGIGVDDGALSVLFGTAAGRVDGRVQLLSGAPLKVDGSLPWHHVAEATISGSGPIEVRSLLDGVEIASVDVEAEHVRVRVHLSGHSQWFVASNPYPQPGDVEREAVLFQFWGEPKSRPAELVSSAWEDRRWAWLR